MKKTTSVRFLSAISVLLCLIAAPGTVAAQHGEAEADEAGAEHGEEGEHGGHEFHRNHVVFFLGSTEAEEHEGEKGDPDFTIGFDYERRLSKRFGIGGMLDLVVEGRREWMLGLAIGKGW